LSSTVVERDSAISARASAIENERDDLNQEVNTLVIECDEARAESDSVRTRIRVVGHQQSNDGSRIYFSRYVVNTTIETVDYAFHVTGYDMTGDPVVNLYVGNSTVSSGYYNAYGHIVNYAALVISSYYVHIEW
jgi:hypothetical protein